MSIGILEATHRRLERQIRDYEERQDNSEHTNIKRGGVRDDQHRDRTTDEIVDAYSRKVSNPNSQKIAAAFDCDSTSDQRCINEKIQQRERENRNDQMSHIISAYRSGLSSRQVK